MEDRLETSKPRASMELQMIWRGAFLFLGVAACGGDAITPTVDSGSSNPVVTSVSMLPPERTIGVLGATVRVVAVAHDQDSRSMYSAYRSPDRFSWSSSAPDVATVDENGQVTAVSEGTASIRATTEGVEGETAVTVRDAARLDWTLPTGVGEIRAGTVIGADGTVYVATRTLLMAISPDGSTLWSLSTPAGVLSTPAIGDDGTLYVGATTEGGLTAVRPDGSVRWTLPDVGSVASSPAIGADGTIYVGSADQHVYAVSPEGEIQWTYEGNERFFLSSPAIASDGTIYIGSSDRHLHAINPDGTAKWTFRARDQIQSSPSIGTNGVIYFGAYDESLYAVNPDGTLLWRSGSLIKRVASSPSIGPDGTIYVGAGGLYAFDSNGSIRWSFREPNTVVTTAILGAGGTVYVVMNDPRGEGGVIQALDSQGMLLWDYPTTETPFGSPAIGLDGRIYATASDGIVYAIVENAPSNGGHGDAPWPQARGDRANTGRAGG